MPHPAPDTLLLVGRCGRPHGVRGEVEVVPETDDPARLAALESFWVGASPERAEERAVESIRFKPFKGGAVTGILKLQGTEGRDGADALRRVNLYADPSALPPLEPGEVYIHDLIGYSVVLQGAQDAPESEPVGTVKDVLTGAAYPLFVVAREGQPDALVPDVEPIVVALDPDARRLVIDPPEGLLE